MAALEKVVDVADIIAKCHTKDDAWLLIDKLIDVLEELDALGGGS